MEDINLGFHSSWIFATQPRLFNTFLRIRKKGEVTASTWSADCLLGFLKPALGLGTQQDGILSWAFNLWLSAFSPFSKMEILEFSGRNLGKINEFMFCKVL